MFEIQSAGVVTVWRSSLVVLAVMTGVVFAAGPEGISFGV